MAQQQPLTLHQQELVNVVKAAHRTLAVSRRTRVQELARRIAAEKIRIDRAFEEAQIQLKMDLDAELVQHEANLDLALLAAYNEGVPVRRIALDGFGNRYDGGVTQLLNKLREDGRIGTREGHQRNTGDPTPTVRFPEPVDMEAILSEATVIVPPTFILNDEPLVLVPPTDSQPAITVPSVRLEMDARDPWFRQIEKNARPGTPHLRATTATLYSHPATGELIAVESRETGDIMWDHPVARWVKLHRNEALEGFLSAVESAE